MILKVLGSVIIIAASGMVGYYLGNQETFRMADLSEMKRAMTILKSEIEFSRSSLPDAFRNISARTKKPVSMIFSLMSEKLCLLPGPGVAAHWKDCLEACRKDTHYNSEDFSILESFGRNLGYLDIEMQNANINMLIDYIDGRVADLALNRDKNRKMFNSLGMLGGLLIVVLLA